MAAGLAFAYPTSSDLAARVALGSALVLTALAAVATSSGSPLHPIWLGLPAGLSFVAWAAIGPGMREELVADPAEKAIKRRVRTMGWPKDETVWGKGEVRMVATARLKSNGGEGATLVLAVDRKGRWLVLCQVAGLEAARELRARIGSALGVPGVEYSIPEEWSPAWGRVQPPAPVTKGGSEPPATGTTSEPA